MENCFPACRPESKPAEAPPVAAKYTQGFAKEPCVTECVVEPEGKMNVTVVPLLAVKFEGLYTNPPAAT